MLYQPVEIGQVFGILGIEKRSDVTDNPFHPAFLIGSVWSTGVNGKAVMPGKVNKLGIEAQHRLSGNYDTLQVVEA